MIHRITPKQWDAMLAVHCTAPFRLIQAAAPVMREAAKKELDERGEATQRCIINVSSTSGTHGNAGQANYATASTFPHLCLLQYRAGKCSVLLPHGVDTARQLFHPTLALALSCMSALSLGLG